MPIVRIVAKGFEGYNGVIEGVQFKDGVSLEPLSLAAAERIGAFMRVEDAETHEPLSVGQRMVNARRAAEGPKESLVRIKRTPTGKEKQPIKKAVVSYDYTKDELEAVADKEGINGLRKVAEQYDVRGRSIREIIESLMALKSNEEAKKAAETVQKPVAAPVAVEPETPAEPVAPAAPEAAADDFADIDDLIEG